jgi:hypothetical protein
MDEAMSDEEQERDEEEGEEMTVSEAIEHIDRMLAKTQYQRDILRLIGAGR